MHGLCTAVAVGGRLGALVLLLAQRYPLAWVLGAGIGRSELSGAARVEEDRKARRWRGWMAARDGDRACCEMRDVAREEGGAGGSPVGRRRRAKQGAVFLSMLPGGEWVLHVVQSVPFLLALPR